MARSYRRDARGRFAGAGYSGQTGGRGARLKASGTRAGGGAKITAGRVGGTIGKPRGLKPANSGSIEPGTRKIYRTKSQAATAQQQRTRRFLRGTAWKTGEYKSATGTAARPLYKKSTAAVQQGSLLGGTETVKRTRLKYAGEANYGGGRSRTDFRTDSRRQTSYIKNAAPLAGTAKGKAYNRASGIARRSQESQDQRVARISSRADSIRDRRSSNAWSATPKEKRSYETRIKANNFLRSASQRAATAGGALNAIRNSPRQSTASRKPKSGASSRRRR
jgi:hypothetical protein